MVGAAGQAQAGFNKSSKVTTHTGIYSNSSPENWSRAPKKAAYGACDYCLLLYHLNVVIVRHEGKPTNPVAGTAGTAIAKRHMRGHQSKRSIVSVCCIRWVSSRGVHASKCAHNSRNVPMPPPKKVLLLRWSLACPCLFARFLLSWCDSHDVPIYIASCSFYTNTGNTRYNGTRCNVWCLPEAKKAQNRTDPTID